MGRPVTFGVVNEPEGRFAVVAVSGSGSVNRRSGFPSLAEAERCIEDLRAAMAACGAPLLDWKTELPATDTQATLGAAEPPLR